MRKATVLYFLYLAFWSTWMLTLAWYTTWRPFAGSFRQCEAVAAIALVGAIALYWSIVLLRHGIAGLGTRAEKWWQPVEYNPRTYWIGVMIVSVIGIAIAVHMQMAQSR
jgi:hypothetical protein